MVIILSAAFGGLTLSLALYGVAAFLAARLSLSAWKAMAGATIVVGVVGLLIFWATFIDVELTRCVQLFAGGAILFSLVEAWRRRSAVDLELIAPSFAILIGGVLLAAWAFLPATPGDDASNPLRMAATRWTYPLPGDNEIPYVFAQQLRMAQIAKNFYGDWLSSDRPPLQTGLYLLLDPLGDHRPVYQGCAMAIQMLVLPGVWSLARSLGTSRAWSVAAMIAVFMTPLFIINATFVWPKLLAGALLCSVAAIHFGERGYRRGAVDGLIAGGGAALALLSHGATAFTLVGFALAALVTLRVFSIRYLASAAALAALLYLPWMIYQRAYDPPGDRLMKWHLAGVTELDSRSFSQALGDSYGTLTFARWWNDRLASLSMATTNPAPELLRTLTGKESRTDLRNTAFAAYPMSFGLFAVGFYLLPLFLLYQPTRALAIATGFGFLMWLTLHFESNQTTTHQGSYFIQLAVIALAVRAFSSGRYPTLAGGVFLAAHVCLTGAIYGLP